MGNSREPPFLTASLSVSALWSVSADMTTSQDDFAEYPRKVRSRTRAPYVVYELVEERSHGSDRVVYATQPEGSAAVPTGRIFIRFEDGIDVAEREGEIEKAGYRIAEKIAYAENAAWLRERSGSVAKALTGIEKLEKIKGVENVEPQMLTSRVSK